MTKQPPAPAPDNPNKEGRPQKGKSGIPAGGIIWETLPPGMVERDGKLVPEHDDGPEGATPKTLSRDQRRDLAKRIRAKLARKG